MKTQQQIGIKAAGNKVKNESILQFQNKNAFNQKQKLFLLKNSFLFFYTLLNILFFYFFYSYILSIYFFIFCLYKSLSLICLFLFFYFYLNLLNNLAQKLIFYNLFHIYVLSSSNSRSNFLRLYFIHFMKITNLVLILAALLAATICADNCQNSIWDDPYLIPTRKGLTYTATQWPSKQNQWTGKMECQGCDPKDGDTLCTIQLPLLCILHHKKLDRPYYFYEPDLSTYHNQDGAFYNPWTGGVLVVTDKIRGLNVQSYQKGDRMCKDYYGFDAKFAEFHDGYYLADMNGYKDQKVKAWGNWSWATAQCGGWSLWGYFNHHWKGRAWVWINNQPNGNCGQI